MSINTAVCPITCYRDLAFDLGLFTGSSADVFCYNLETLLEERQLKPAEFARRIKVSRSLVSLWISGARFPRPNHLDAIAGGLGVPVARLFLDPDDPDQPPEDQPKYEPEREIDAAMIALSALRAKLKPEKT